MSDEIKYFAGCIHGLPTKYAVTPIAVAINKVKTVAHAQLHFVFCKLQLVASQAAILTANQHGRWKDRHKLVANVALKCRKGTNVAAIVLAPSYFDETS